MKEWGLENVALEPWADTQQLPARLDEREVLPGGRVAAGVPDSRHAARLDAGHQRPRSRRGGAGDRDDAGGSAEEYAGETEGQVDHRRRRRPTWRRTGTAPATREHQEELQQMELATDAGPAEFGVPRARLGRRRAVRGAAAQRRGGGRRPAGGRRRRLQPQRVLQDRRACRRAARPRRAATASTRSAATAPPTRRRACRDRRFRPSSTAASRGMIAKNLPVTIEADIKNTFHPEPADVQRRRRDPRHRQGRRGRDARRALRLVACLDGRHRQRGRIGRDDGSDAHPQAERRHAAPHGAHRPVDRRRAGADRIARSTCSSTSRAAVRLRRPPAGAARRGGRGGARPRRSRSSSSRSTRSSPATSTSTTAPARSAASTCSRTRPSARSSARGWSRSAASA